RRSGPSKASGSPNTVTASSNETPCLVRLTAAFRASHSNTVQYILNPVLLQPVITAATITRHPIKLAVGCRLDRIYSVAREYRSGDRPPGAVRGIRIVRHEQAGASGRGRVPRHGRHVRRFRVGFIS